jgi:phosphoribosyl-dephospho-CoA transferase
MDPRPHDLLRLSPKAFELPDHAPAWAACELTRGRPWVVVRRAVAGPDTVAVGVRGSARWERWAFSVRLASVRERVAPEELARGRFWRTISGLRRQLPALAVLEAVAGALEGHDLAWGPGGSVGYELASGLPAVRASSDLDLILRCPERLPRATAREILEDLAPLPVHVDAQIDTGNGSFALAEWAAGKEVLLRRAGGPALTEDPWGAHDLARDDILTGGQGS